MLTFHWNERYAADGARDLVRGSLLSGRARELADQQRAQEAAIDMEWVHAMAPMAKIYLVEAASSGLSDMMQAVQVAANLPAVRQVSMSWGSLDLACSYVHYDDMFVKSGVVFFAASGDSGGVRNFPALSRNVVAVGGTNLNVTAGGAWVAETVWSSTGCGKSGSEPRPAFQDAVYAKVGLYRGSCDLSAVADPATGVAAYDSYEYGGIAGWFTVGGTSVSCQIIAGIVNSTGVTFAGSRAFNAKLYSGIGGSAYHDVTSGIAGSMHAGPGWDFPTGVGTPLALGAFFGGS